MYRRLRSRSVHNFGTCIQRTAAQWQNPIFHASKHVFFRKSPLRIGSPNASTEVVHRARSQSPLHSESGTYSRFVRNINFLALGVCFPQPCLSAGRRHQDHVYKTTEESLSFHNKIFDEMCCKLDSTENPRSFEKYPTPP